MPTSTGSGPAVGVSGKSGSHRRGHAYLDNPLRTKGTAFTEEERREFLVTIEQESQRLNNIVGNLLDLSRIQGGTLHPDRGWYELADLIATGSTYIDLAPFSIGRFSADTRSP